MNRLAKAAFLTSLFLTAEVLLYISYSGHDANFHWFTHFFVGGIAAFIGMSVYMTIKKRPARFPLLWILVGHIFAMIPDLLFNLANIAHYQWMDIFLGHISTHFVPGRNVTWLVLWAIALAGYLYVLYKTQNTKVENK